VPVAPADAPAGAAADGGEGELSPAERASTALFEAARASVVNVTQVPSSFPI
jgi:hypothetical protein